MHSSRRTVSRGLIVVLVLAVGVGAFSVFHKTSKTRGAVKPADADAVKATPSPTASAALPIGIRPQASVAPPPPMILNHPAPALGGNQTPLLGQTTTPDVQSAVPQPTPDFQSPAQLPSTRPAFASAAGSSSPWPSDNNSSTPQILDTRADSGGTSATAQASSPAPAPTYTASPDGPLAGGKAMMDAGKLLEARAELNDALQSGKLSEADIETAKAMMADINKTVVFSARKFADDTYGGAYVVKPGDSMAKIAAAHDVTWELLSRINNGLEPRRLRSGATIKVLQGPFFAVVDKKKFTLDVYLGALPGEKSSMYVTTLHVGLGRDDSTPTGTWMVEPHKKIKHPTYYSPRGEGVIAADDPKNPLGPCWVGLTGVDGQAVGKLSYGIHGTIDPDSIGKQSSMGCIRLHNEDALMVYDLMVEGKSMVMVKE